MNTFKYLGATLTESGDLDAEMTHRIQSGWKNWKRVSVCPKKVARPAMRYGTETWPVKKAREEVGCGGNEPEDVRWMRESPSWTELGMKELEGQRRSEKYPRKCRKVG